MYRDEGMFFLEESEGTSTETLAGTNTQERSKESPYESSLESIASLRREHEQLVLSDSETDFLDVSNLLKEKVANTLEYLDTPNLSSKSKATYLANEWGGDYLIKALLRFYEGPVETERAMRRRGSSFKGMPSKGFIFTKRFKEHVYSADRYPAGRYLLEVLPEFLKLLHSVLDNSNLAKEWIEEIFREGHDWLLIYSERVVELREEIKRIEGI